jgi:hypothetical protein
MPLTRLSSRALNQDVGSAKRAAQDGPVIITDRGKPAHVLMTYDAWLAREAPPRSLTDAIAMPGLTDIDLDVPKAEIRLRDAGLD